MLQPVSIIAVDSVTKLTHEHTGLVVVSGSHGGLYAAYLAAAANVRAVILNDAGIGLEDAGIAGVRALETHGMAAAAVSVTTARIGDARDSLENGELSYVNAVAARLGCRIGQTCRTAADRLRLAPEHRVPDAGMSEGRYRLRTDPSCASVWGLDSASLVAPEDRGAILVIGSHGGVPGGDPANALRVDAGAAFFNDAGVGKDCAGLSRLPMLDHRRIPAAAVAAASARIGDAKSSWETGIVSFVNHTAAALGVEPGSPVQLCVARLIGAIAQIDER